jgi:chromate transporter
MSHSAFGLAEFLALSSHFMSLSLFTVGGVMVTAPQMHHFLVRETGWLTDLQFAGSIAIAQAAPGPNVLFVALLGWNIGVNAVAAGTASWWAPGLGLVAALIGILAPSAALTYFVGRWLHNNRGRRHVRAFRSGMAPVVIGLLLATGWMLTTAQYDAGKRSLTYIAAAAATLLVWRTRIHFLWLFAAGALLGVLGVV